MHRLKKQSELDKISKDIIDEIYPVKALENYFLLGYAECLSSLTDAANQCINGKYADKLDAHELKLIINEIAYSSEILKDYYLRLRKDGVKTNAEKDVFK